ncbi:hypothetical protein A5CPEGH6_23060 [Alistipes dispar]|uniref:DNA (cytosine-5-)-methyltransferase n=1 Tax=Alistipes dispar TaxID=2585119 RepID=A0A4Y1X5S1_9BACT|nr:hypothetical protein A5CPEGH6_23060 [Alistipes dispar]
MPSLENIGVIDLFCGVGGLSYGLKRAGLNVLAGFDIDKTCRFAYEHNNEAKFFDTDIKRVSGEEIRTLFGDSKIKVLAGCAPCQPFSSYAFSNKDKDPNKYDLLYQFGRSIEEGTTGYRYNGKRIANRAFQTEARFNGFHKSVKIGSFGLSCQCQYCVLSRLRHSSNA